MRHSRLCCWDGKQRRWESFILYPPSSCGKRRLIRGGGSTARISDGTRPQDPGGGEAQLTASQDVAVARPVFPPTSQPVIVQPDEMRLYAMRVDETRRPVDGALSTVSDSMTVWQYDSELLGLSIR